MNTTVRKCLVGLALAAVTLATFWPVRQNEFTNYDDLEYVTENPQVAQGLTWANVSWAFRTDHAANWHPLTWLSHMLDVQLFGLRPGAHHLVSVAFHIANALLLFWLLQKLTASLWRSAFVAGLFALHPLHVESVAWAAERKDVLSGFFFFLALLAYAYYVRSEARTPRPREPRPRNPQPASPFTHPASRITHPLPRAALFYCAAVLLFALGLMSKPMLVTFPFVLLLLDHWPLRRLQRRTASRLVLEKAPFLALSAASCVLTFVIQQQGETVSSLERLPLSVRLVNILLAYERYFQKTFWPEGLAVFYPLTEHWMGWAVAGAGLLLLLKSLGVLVARRQPWLFTGWFWFLGMLVPVIGLVQVGAQSMADRYTYLPLVGLFIMLAWGLDEIGRRQAWPKERLAALAALVLGGCALLSFRQTQIWRTSETLFRHALAVTTGNHLAYENLGFYCWQQGRTAEAIDNYRKSLAICVKPHALNNLGILLANQGNFPEALRLYQQALQVQPDYVVARRNLADALAKSGKLDEAIAQIQECLRARPDDLAARNDLGVALTLRGRGDEAVEQFRHIVAAMPNAAGAHGNLARALAGQNQLAEAIQEFRECVRLSPGDARAHQFLGHTLSLAGKLDEAIGEYNEALRLAAGNPELHYELGSGLEQQGKRDEAVVHYTEALRLDPAYEPAQKQLKALSAKP